MKTTMLAQLDDGTAISASALCNECFDDGTMIQGDMPDDFVDCTGNEVLACSMCGWNVPITFDDALAILGVS